MQPINHPSINIAIIQPLIQKELDYMEAVSCWARKAAKRAHIVGLKGERNRLRYLSRKARHIVDWTEYCVCNVFKLDICAQPGTADVSALACPMSTMNGIVEKLFTIYFETHQIVNDLETAKLKHIGNCLDKYTDELFQIINELQSARVEYEMADYEYHHVSRYQVAWANVADKYSCEEEKQGFIDHW